MRLIITRPLVQSAAWQARLQAAGVDAVALPLIAIAPAQDAQAVRQAWQRLPTLAFAMFVSANAVQHFFAARPEGARWPAALQAGSTGPGTAAALRAAGLSAEQVVTPEVSAGRFDSEALWALISDREWAGTEVLVVRGEDGRPWLAEHWRAAGARVQFVAAYRRLPPTLDAAGQATLDAARTQPADCVWHFSSSEAIAQLMALAPGASWQSATALVTHERIEDRARQAGFGRVILVGAGVQEALRGFVLASPAAPPSLQSSAS